ncbi:MAG: ferritin-like domain-containing protein [Pseudomonadota bacterium]|nr:ferritin-like domain-containing protein [Pseudomonadota bacterium]
MEWSTRSQIECAVVPTPIPGHPDRPLLLAPRALKSRGLGSALGRAALIHAVAHIEFNAINLALDAMYRFRDLPVDYYRDWYSVAVDEARHFELLSDRLHQLGFAYGDFPAHNGLWEAACNTAHSCLARMALVPRVLEARGLDVTPGMIDRLEHAGDQPTAAILRIILSEEVAHVAIGTRWFRYCCAQQGLDPDPTFLELVRVHSVSAIRRPFNEEARRVAGFTDGEQMALARMADVTASNR